MKSSNRRIEAQKDAYGVRALHTGLNPDASRTLVTDMRDSAWTDLDRLVEDAMAC